MPTNPAVSVGVIGFVCTGPSIVLGLRSAELVLHNVTILAEIVGEVVSLQLLSLVVPMDKDRLHAELVKAFDVAEATLLLFQFHGLKLCLLID